MLRYKIIESLCPSLTQWLKTQQQFLTNAIELQRDKHSHFITTKLYSKQCVFILEYSQNKEQKRIKPCSWIPKELRIEVLGWERSEVVECLPGISNPLAHSQYSNSQRTEGLTSGNYLQLQSRFNLIYDLLRNMPNLFKFKPYSFVLRRFYIVLREDLAA